MSLETFHPLAVHLPIALLLLWPVVDAIGLWLDRGDVCHTALGLLVLALPASLFATVSGQAAYDVALEKGMEASVLDQHGGDASLVPWLALLVFAIRFLGVKKYGNNAHRAAVLGGLILAGFVFLVAKSGGVLVFEHAVGVRPGSW